MLKKWPCFWFVVVLVFLCFIPDLQNELLDWDDAGYILENKNIHSLSLSMLGWAFNSIHLNYWAPLMWISLAVDYAIWGSNPFGYHLSNNIFHSFSCGLFFLICTELLTVPHAGGRHTAETKASNLSDHLPLACALLAAVFFAIHPLRVESVAWATERKDVLSLFFGLFSILFYLIYARKGRIEAAYAYWLSLAFFILSLLSKSLLVTLPVVLMVLDWFPLRRIHFGLGRLFIEKVPYFLLSGCISLITINAQSKVIEPIDFQTRFLNAVKSIVAYLWLTLWPSSVSPFYVHPFNIQVISPQYAIAIVSFIAITIFCIAMVRSMPIFIVVWMIYLITLMPFLGLTQQIGPQAMAGRFTYLSGLPLALLLAIGVSVVYEKCAAGSRSAVFALGAVVAAALMANLFLTIREISFWKDDVTLWTRVIELSPNTGRAYFQRSKAYSIKRDYQKALPDMDVAVAIAESKHYRAIYELYLARAEVLVGMGAFPEAVAAYTKSMETAAATARKMILYQRGIAFRQMGKHDLADADFRASGL